MLGSLRSTAVVLRITTRDKLISMREVLSRTGLAVDECIVFLWVGDLAGHAVLDAPMGCIYRPHRDSTGLKYSKHTYTKTIDLPLYK